MVWRLDEEDCRMLPRGMDPEGYYGSSSVLSSTTSMDSHLGDAENTEKPRSTSNNKKKKTNNDETRSSSKSKEKKRDEELFREKDARAKKAKKKKANEGEPSLELSLEMVASSTEGLAEHHQKAKAEPAKVPVERTSRSQSKGKKKRASKTEEKESDDIESSVSRKKARSSSAKAKKRVKKAKEDSSRTVNASIKKAVNKAKKKGQSSSKTPLLSNPLSSATSRMAMMLSQPKSAATLAITQCTNSAQDFVTSTLASTSTQLLIQERKEGQEPLHTRQGNLVTRRFQNKASRLQRTLSNGSLSPVQLYNKQNTDIETIMPAEIETSIPEDGCEGYDISFSNTSAMPDAVQEGCDEGFDISFSNTSATSKDEYDDSFGDVEEGTNHVGSLPSKAKSNMCVESQSSEGGLFRNSLGCKLLVGVSILAVALAVALVVVLLSGND